MDIDIFEITKASTNSYSILFYHFNSMVSVDSKSIFNFIYSSSDSISRNTINSIGSMDFLSIVERLIG
jgi:hypothetical protein